MNQAKNTRDHWRIYAWIVFHLKYNTLKRAIIFDWDLNYIAYYFKWLLKKYIIRFVKWQRISIYDFRRLSEMQTNA